MTFNFEAPENNQQSTIDESARNHLERDRFELLSAYLDGEVTPAERQQVQQWIETDPKIQQLYSRLLQLRQGMQTLPFPKPEQSVQQFSEEVFRRISRRQHNRRAWLWGGGALAALFIGVVSTVLTETHSPTPQIAQSPQTETNAELLMVALNRPAVAIPPAVVSYPSPSSQPSIKEQN